MLRIQKVVKYICNAKDLSLVKNGNIKCEQNIQNNTLIHLKLKFSTDSVIDLETEKKKLKKKTVRIPKITLIHPDQSITVTILEEAQRLAKRRKLELVQVSNYDPKNDRSVYKLISSTEFSEIKDTDDTDKEFYKGKRKIKSTKLFTFKTKICLHDLLIKINNINKVLEKGHKVKVFLLHTDGGQESLLQTIKQKVVGTVLTEKVQKGSTVLTFSPLLEDSVSTTNESQSKEGKV